jgi:hypothetical protein
VRSRSSPSWQKKDRAGERVPGLALVQPALRPAPQVDVAQPVEHERSVSRFEAEGFRAKIYRTAARPLEEDVNVQGDHHRRQVNAAG